MNAKRTASCLAMCLLIGSGCAQVPSNLDLSSLVQNEKSAKARRSSVQAQRRRNNQFERLFARARSLEKQNRPQLAITAYQKLAQQFPNEGRVLHRLAVCQDSAGDANESSSLYLRALHFSPNDPNLLCDYGYSRYVHGDMLQAETMLRRAIKIDPKHSRSRANLGLVLAKLGRDDEAIAAFEQSGLPHEAAIENLRQLQLISGQGTEETTTQVVMRNSPPQPKHNPEQGEASLLSHLTRNTTDAEYVGSSIRNSIRR